MMYKIGKCPFCGAQMKVDQRHAGYFFFCPVCEITSASYRHYGQAVDASNETIANEIVID